MITYEKLTDIKGDGWRFALLVDSTTHVTADNRLTATSTDTQIHQLLENYRSVGHITENGPHGQLTLHRVVFDDLEVVVFMRYFSSDTSDKALRTILYELGGGDTGKFECLLHVNWDRDMIVAQERWLDFSLLQPW